MARRPNYGAEKRQKEIQRQKKKEDKAEKKRLKKETPGEQGGDELNDEELDLAGLGLIEGAGESDPDADR